MSLELLMSLGGLAIIDMLSPAAIAATILVLLNSTRPVRLLTTFWTTVALAYFGFGVLLMLGLDLAFTALSAEVGRWVQLIVGLTLFVGSFFIPEASKSKSSSAPSPRALTVPAMVAFGLGTFVLEAATAVPYVAATALMTAAGTPPALWVLALTGYVILMLAPCYILLVMWLVSGDWVRNRMEHWRTKLARGSRETASWIIGVAGFILAANAAYPLLTEMGLIGN